MLLCTPEAYSSMNECRSLSCGILCMSTVPKALCVEERPSDRMNSLTPACFCRWMYLYLCQLRSINVTQQCCREYGI